jgi:hypothetical protein
VGCDDGREEGRREVARPLAPVDPEGFIVDDGNAVGTDQGWTEDADVGFEGALVGFDKGTTVGTVDGMDK